MKSQGEAALIMDALHQKLPGAGAAREALRRKGQFWTPAWVAEAMVGYAMSGGSREVFDPAVGAGAFFRAAKIVAAETGRDIELRGTEIDADVLEQARENGLDENDLARVDVTDFVLRQPAGKFKAIVANPPYIRHHRIPAETKAALRKLAVSLIGAPLDGRAGLHVYFLLRALESLDENGRLAFIMPADTCEGVFAPTLWRWMAKRFRLDAVVTFDTRAAPFPKVDTNALVFLIRHAVPQTRFHWVKCHEANNGEIKAWILSGFKTKGASLEIHERETAEAIFTGLSRPPVRAHANKERREPVLGDYARTMRGVATGANEFFFLTRKRASELEIPDEFLVSAIGRTRDVMTDALDSEAMNALDRRGRPTLLFAPDGRSLESFPARVREYLRRGESLGLHERSLISTRRPWYKMEKRDAPAFLFAYLGRRNARFIRNHAHAVPLTGFLCIYPRQMDDDFINRLWTLLRHSEMLDNLRRVGKSYGGGAIKVEPRSLEKLPLPRDFDLQLEYAPSSLFAALP